MVSGLTIVATSARACFPSLWPISARGFALAVTQADAPLDLVAEDAILRDQILVAQAAALDRLFPVMYAGKVFQSIRPAPFAILPSIWRRVCMMG